MRFCLVIIAYFTVLFGGIDPDEFCITVNTKKNGVTSNKQFRIPAVNSNNYSVDCNNDDVWEVVGHSGAYDCNYSAKGVYTICIKGIKRIKFANQGDKLKLISINHWGTTQWTSMSQAFEGCANLIDINASDTPDLSASGISLSKMFKSCASLDSSSLNNWDVSQATNMSSMFEGASNFNQSLNNWNTSNVTTMARMFYGATHFNGSIVSWDTHNVVAMNQMFYKAKQFNQPIGNWDTSGVTTMKHMFDEAELFDGNISSWNTSSVTDMSYMFKNAKAFNQPIGNWDVSNVTDMQQMFNKAKQFNQNLNSWDVSHVTNMNNMFNRAQAFNGDISSWNTANVSNMRYMFNRAVSFDRDLSGWNVTSLTDATKMLLKSGLTTPNYDALLIGWAAQSVHQNVHFNAKNTKFCSLAARNARDTLINTYHWVIIDGGECNTAVLSFEKSSIVIDDPENGVNNPKRIPEATIRYCFTVTNSGLKKANSVVITDDLTGNGKDRLDYQQSGSIVQDSATACDCAALTAINGQIDAAKKVTINIGTLTSRNNPSTARACAYIEAKVQ